MANCACCGHPLTGSRAFFFIVCKDCETIWPKIQAERKAAAAKAHLDLLIGQHIKGGKLQFFGIAYWNTAGSSVDTVFNKIVGAALFGAIGMGGIGLQMTGSTHRLGIMAVTETKLNVIEIGEVVGETVSPDSLGTYRQGKGSCYDLKNVILENKKSTASGILTIISPIQLKATFPASYDSENKSRAAQIADAIEIARKGKRAVQENLLINDQKKEPEQRGSYCPNCGFQAQPDDRFCMKCGEKLV